MATPTAPFPIRTTGGAPPSGHAAPLPGRNRALALICLAEFLAMSIWFSFSAIKPLIAEGWGISNGDAGLILSAFQFGYIVSVFWVGYLADRYNTRTVVAVSALLAAALNLLFGLVAWDRTSAMVLRFLVGAAIAGAYTPTVKLVAGWFPPAERGRAVGLLVGALVAGSASPYLLTPLAVAFGWRTLVFATVACAALAAFIIWRLVPDAPGYAARPAVPPKLDFGLLRDRPLALINLGYVAHMWELYAMWAWIGPFLVWVLAERGAPIEVASADGGRLAFFVVAAGAIACALAGWLGDHYGRTLTTSLFLVVSAACSFVIGPLAGAPFALLAVVGLIYGFAIVGDSPLYSARVTELAPPDNIGAALGLQSVLGFGTTIISTWLFGVVADRWGWTAAFVMLGLGAALGPIFLLYLRSLPASARLAGGRR